MNLIESVAIEEELQRCENIVGLMDYMAYIAKQQICSK